MPNYNVRPNSLLDMVRNNPEKFNGVGFVFSGERIAEEDAEQARQVFGKNHLQAEAQHAINKWPSGDMFVGWGDEETRNWPGRFFEFWMPKKRLQVLAREVAYRDQDAQAVFVRRAWQGIKGQVGLELPTLASIERSDAEIAAKIISDDGYAFFANANDLWKRLIEIGDK